MLFWHMDGADTGGWLLTAFKGRTEGGGWYFVECKGKDTQHHNYQVTPLNSDSPSTFNSCPPAVDENEVGEEDGEESVQPVARQELRLIRHQVPYLVHQRGRVFGWAQLYGCVAGQLRGYGRSGGFRVGHFKTDRIGAGGATTLALLYAPWH